MSFLCILECHRKSSKKLLQKLLEDEWILKKKIDLRGQSRQLCSFRRLKNSPLSRKPKKKLQRIEQIPNKHSQMKGSFPLQDLFRRNGVFRAVFDGKASPFTQPMPQNLWWRSSWPDPAGAPRFSRGFFRCQAWGNDPKNVGSGGGTEVVEDGVLMTSSFGLHGFRFHILGFFWGVHKVIVCWKQRM